jgi:hypothetical protein
MSDSKTLSKYLKVRALAREGAPGERETAKRILEKMQDENPGIEAEAAAFEGAENVEAEPTSDPFGTGNWEQLFRFAAQAAGFAYSYAQNVGARPRPGASSSRYAWTPTCSGKPTS